MVCVWYLKWLLDVDQDQVLTFSNPALKSAVWGRERKDIKFFLLHLLKQV